jgi:hypothetical protein
MLTLQLVRSSDLQASWWRAELPRKCRLAAHDEQSTLQRSTQNTTTRIGHSNEKRQIQFI